MSTPDWFQSFLDWLRKPSPTKEWLYRGQAARYGTIVPALLRPSYREFYGNKLHELSPSVVKATLETSPIFDSLYPHTISDALSLQLESLLSRHFGGPPSNLPQASFWEVMRALAQHYGFPTLFIDLTTDPMVAAFFATHAFANQRYSVQTDDTGIIYRWPAVRTSAARLKIPGSGNANTAEQTWINAVDLTEINLYMRRPRNQNAVLATPVSRPFSPLSPEGLRPRGGVSLSVTPIEELDLVELAALPSCETFELPSGVGYDLAKLTGVSADALFPDRIDLGYSYLSLMALLSLCIHDPDAWGVSREGETGIDDVRDFFAAGVLAARTVLGRESFRLAQGFRPSDVPRDRTLLEAKTQLVLMADAAKAAAHALTSPQVLERRAVLVQKLNAAIREEYELRQRAWEAAVRKVVGDDAQVPGKSPALGGEQRAVPIEWIIPEIERRLRQAQDITDNADKVPAYALEDAATYHRLLSAFPSDPSYEEEVHRQVLAQQQWRPGAPVFPRFA